MILQNNEHFVSCHKLCTKWKRVLSIIFRVWYCVGCNNELTCYFYFQTVCYTASIIHIGIMSYWLNVHLFTKSRSVGLFSEMVKCSQAAVFMRKIEKWVSSFHPPPHSLTEILLIYIVPGCYYISSLNYLVVKTLPIIEQVY